MKRIISAVVMVAIAAGSHFILAPAAKAADVDGGWIGRELAGPPAYPAPPPHYAPAPAYPPAPIYPPAPVFAPARDFAPAPVLAPAPVDVDEGECRLIRQQYFDGYGYRIRRVQVCD